MLVAVGCELNQEEGQLWLPEFDPPVVDHRRERAAEDGKGARSKDVEQYRKQNDGERAVKRGPRRAEWQPASLCNATAVSQKQSYERRKS